MEDKLTQAKQLLKKYDQEHIIEFFPKLSEEQQLNLADQIIGIDFEELNKLYNLTIKKELDVAHLEPVEAINPVRIPKEMLEEYIRVGEQVVKNNKLAVVTVAGRTTERGFGNGGPKGTFKLDIGQNRKVSV